MSFYGGTSQGTGPGPGQRGPVPSHNMTGSQANPGDVLPPQIFNFAPNQLQFQATGASGTHSISFPDPGSQIQMQNTIQLTPGGPPQLLLHQQQQQQNFSNLNVNFLTEQIGVGQILQPQTAAGQNAQIPVQNLITPISVALTGVNFAQPIQAQPQTGASQPSSQAKQRVFTGTVTKTHDNFGFIDEEVFFQMRYKKSITLGSTVQTLPDMVDLIMSKRIYSVVKGVVLPKPGDRVLVEADFNPSMPFKWNATRVQIVNIGGLNNNLPNMNLNPGGKPPSPQPMSQQQASLLAQHGSNSAGTNLLNLNFNQQNHNNSQKSNPPSQNSSVLPNQGHGQSQPQSQGGPRYPPGANSVTLMSNPHSAYGLRNNNVRVEDTGRGMGNPRTVRTRPPPPPNISGTGQPMVSLSSMVDPHGVQHIQLPLPLQLPISVPLQIPSLLQQLDQRERDMDKADRDREMRERERDRERDRERQEREREKDHERRERERERERSLEREKEREKEREREYERKRERDREREKQKRLKDDIKREREKDREREKRESPSRAGRTRSPVAVMRESRKRSRSRSKGRDKDTRERSKSRSNSPKRLQPAVRPVPRYGWELPKTPFDMMDISVSEIKRRYRNLYIPSDFVMAKCVWQESFPLHKPLDISHSSPVHIFRRHSEKIDLKEVFLKPKIKDGEAALGVLRSPDESDILKVKVVLLSLPPKASLYRKSCGLAEESAEANLQHPSRLLNFVVGTKMAKNEAMLIGGAWSAMLDGPNPETNPQVLINTAIRTTKALTGLDLRRCTKWYRFMDFYYRRGNGTIATVVVLLPNIWTALPSRREWEEIQRNFKDSLCGDVKDENGSNDTTSKAVTTPRKSADSHDSEGTTEQPDVTIPAGAQGQASSEEQVDGKSAVVVDHDLGLTEDASSPVLTKMEVGSEECQNSQNEGKNENDSKSEDVDIYDDLPPAPEAPQPEGSGCEDMDFQSSAPVGTTLIKQEVQSGDAAQSEVVDANAGSHKETLEPGDSTVGDVPGEEPPESDRIGSSGWTLSALRAFKVVELKDELRNYGLSATETKGLKKCDLVELLAKQIKESHDLSKVKSEGAEEEGTVDDTPEKLPPDNQSNGSTEQPMDCKEEIPKDPSTIQNEASRVDSAGDAGEVEKEGDSVPEKDDNVLEEKKQDDRNADAKELEQKSTEASSVKTKRVGLTYQVPVLPDGTNEKTRKVWERRYALPKSPHLLIHPSVEAKSGIFDCNLHSLHTLRDYRLADNKEQSFEVSLCSELFHEMLQRDFAFRIYRELVYQAGLNLQEEKDEKCPGSVLPKEESPTKKRKISTSTNGSAPKMKTADPYLLLAFTYFDHTRCGYITESDLEELCLSPGIGLSRSQVRKLVQKVCLKGNLFYRKWADVPCVDGVVPPKVPRTDGAEDNLIHLSSGNKSLLPTFGKPRLELQDILLHQADGENLKKETESLLAACDSDSSLVNSKQLRDQLEKSEKDRTVLETNLNLVKNSLTESRVQLIELKKSNESLKDELGKTKDLLRKAENSEATVQSELEILRKAAERFFDRVKDVIKFRPVAQGSQDG